MALPSVEILSAKDEMARSDSDKTNRDDTWCLMID